MKEFKLTAEEEKLLRERAKYKAEEQKHIILDIPYSLDDLIESLKETRRKILWDVPNIDVDEISWLPEEVHTYDDYTDPSIKVLWEKPIDPEKDYQELKREFLDDKNKRYLRYLELQKEFNDTV